MTTILFRYMLREFVKVFAMCFAGLLTIYLVVDFFEKLRKFIRYDANLLTLLEFFALRTPLISFQVAPFAVLMATLLTLGVFSRNREITAMRACGISLNRIAAPFLCFSMVVGLGLFGLSAVVIPLTTIQATLRFAGTTLMQPTAENGLRQASVALVFQVRAIDRHRVQERIGNVSAEVLDEIFAELDKLTGRLA